MFLSSHLLGEVEQVCDRRRHRRPRAARSPPGPIADVLAAARPSGHVVKVSRPRRRRAHARRRRLRRRRSTASASASASTRMQAEHVTRALVGRRPLPERAAAGRDQPRGRVLRPHRRGAGMSRPARGRAPADRRRAASSGVTVLLAAFGHRRRRHRRVRARPRSLSETTYQQRVRAAEVQQDAQRTKTEACLARQRQST